MAESASATCSGLWSPQEGARIFHLNKGSAAIFRLPRGGGARTSGLTLYSNYNLLSERSSLLLPGCGFIMVCLLQVINRCEGPIKFIVLQDLGPTLFTSLLHYVPIAPHLFIKGTVPLIFNLVFFRQSRPFVPLAKMLVLNFWFGRVIIIFLTSLQYTKYSTVLLLGSVYCTVYRLKLLKLQSYSYIS